MATILDLFLSNPDLTGGASNAETPAEHLEHGIEVSYKNSDLAGILPRKLTVQNGIIKTYEQTDIPNKLPGEKTLGEILKDSIRVKSLVDINNPLIYGTDVPRIVARSTRTLEIMKAGRNDGITNGNNGLIGKGISAVTGGKLSSINDVRNKIGDFLGLPQPYIPTVVAGKLEPGVSVQDVLDKRDGDGTGLGKFLRQTGGGNPKTFATQALGTAITFGKDKLRNALFGNPFAIDEVAGSANQKFEGWYDDQNTYTIVLDKQDYRAPIESNSSFAINYEENHKHIKPINLADYSPVYGVDRNSNLWNTELGDRIKKDRDTNPNLSKRLQPYDPTNSYTGKDGERPPIWDRSLEEKYKLSSKSDGVNLIRDVKEQEKSLDEIEDMDLIPFWIGIKDGAYKTHFRALLSGISETVSPSWNSNKFYGNPFEFYTYSGVSRQVTFSLLIYCSNPVELGFNWEKVNSLTKYTYPTLGDTKTTGKVMNPPIIEFKLGHIYNTQTGYISSLSYTFPDNGTWETDKTIGFLPKMIEVSISIQFIETANTKSLKKLYGYTITEAAAARMNEEDGSNTFSTNPSLLSNGSVVPDKPIKVTTKKLQSPIEKIRPATIGGIELKSMDELLQGTIDPLDSQSGVTDIGKKLTTGIDSLNPKQQETWDNTLKAQGYGNYYGSDIPLNPGQRVYRNIGTGNKVVLKLDGNVLYF